jgi:peptide/nickel transport system ATP-binding protein
MSPADSPATTPVLELRDLRVTRADGWSVALDELSLSAGGVGALVGPSGCGKTSLLLGWLGLTGDAVSGACRVLGAAWPPAHTSAGRQMLAGPVTVLLQDARATFDPLARVGAQLLDLTGRKRAACQTALADLGLADPLRIFAAWPHQLSGGQAQRVLLAVAFLRAPRLLIADEPTAGLDGASIDDFTGGLEILRAAHGTAVLVSTHDLSLVEALGAALWRHDGARFVAAGHERAAWPAADFGTTGACLLRATGVRHAFGATGVLDGVDLELLRGEVVALVGSSGCGKTTLAQVLARQLTPDAGRIDGPRGVLLPQDALGSLTPGRSIRSLVAETAVDGFDLEVEAAAVGLPPASLDRTAARLSGGERRRAALLRALSVGPQLLILDEPTASLDYTAARAVMETVLAVQRRRGLTCLWITHDPDLAAAYAHRVLTLHGGRLG